MPLEEFLCRSDPLRMPPPAAEAASLPIHRPYCEKLPNPRLAASLHFLGDGMIFGTWAALIPSFKAKFGINEAQLSLALLAIAAGAILSMPIVGRTVARYGSRPNLRFIAPGFCLSLVLLFLAPGFSTFLVAALIFGAVKGGFNVAANSQAITIENAAAKPVISGFHALWSLGGMLAAIITGAALKAGIPPNAIAPGIAVLLAIVVLASAPNLLGGDASPPKEKSPGFRLPDGKLIRIGLITFMALFAEGVMMDWSVVYTRTVSHAEPWLAPFAYGIFSGCMAAGRLAGGLLIRRLSPARVLTLGGILTTAGISVIVLFHYWPATFAGLALAGFGLANLVPILFGAGGRTHNGGTGNGIALVSIMGYFGFLIGPPLIGGLSHHAGLPGAFALVAAFAAFIALLGNRFLGEIPSSAKS